MCCVSEDDLASEPEYPLRTMGRRLLWLIYPTPSRLTEQRTGSAVSRADGSEATSRYYTNIPDFQSLPRNPNPNSTYENPAYQKFALYNVISIRTITQWLHHLIGGGRLAMTYAKRVARCTECRNIMTAKADGNGNQFLMGMNECPRCGCEDFDILEVNEFKYHSRATDD